MAANWWRFFIDLRDLAFNHEARIQRLEREERNIVTTLDDVKATVQGLVAEDSIVVTAINDLKTRLDNGETVTSQDLTDLQASLQSEVQRLTDAVSNADPGVQNPPAPDTGDTGDTPDSGNTPAPDTNPPDAGPVTA